MQPTTYKVICKNCGKSEVIPIDKDNNVYWGKVTNIISARHRLDMQWGFQCAICGNNDLETDQERSEIKNLQAPDPADISKVLKSLKTQKPRFEMIAI